MTAAMIPPVITTVPAVIRNPLHQQSAYLGEKKQGFPQEIFFICVRTDMHVISLNVYMSRYMLLYNQRQLLLKILFV